MFSLKSFRFRNVFLGGSKTDPTLVHIRRICEACVERTWEVSIRLDLFIGDDVRVQAFLHTILLIAAMQLNL